MKKLTDKEKWDILKQSQASLAAKKNPPQDALEAQKTMGELGLAYLTDTVSQLSSDSAADFLRNFTVDLQKEILNGLQAENREDIEDILAYAPESTGSVMAKEYMAVDQQMTVGEAIDELQSIPVIQRGRAPYIYVIDREKRPQGVIKTEDLIFHAKETSIPGIMKKPVDTIKAGARQEEAARMFQAKRYLALPVLDHRGKLTGVVSASNMIQRLREQADRDIAKMVGTGAEEIKSRSVFRILRLRMPWLFVSIASGLLCAFVSGLFQNSIQTLAVLFLFVPVVLGLSESIGIQGATIVVRNLAVSRVQFKDFGNLLFREMMVGIVIGLLCGLIVGGAAFLWKQSWVLGAAISASMNVAIVVSALLGLLLPLIFKSLKVDPAIASGPLVLALCDIQTLLVYFNLASSILQR